MNCSSFPDGLVILCFCQLTVDCMQYVKHAGSAKKTKQVMSEEDVHQLTTQSDYWLHVVCKVWIISKLKLPDLYVFSYWACFTRGLFESWATGLLRSLLHVFVQILKSDSSAQQPSELIELTVWWCNTCAARRPLLSLYVWAVATGDRWRCLRDRGGDGVCVNVCARVHKGNIRRPGACVNCERATTRLTEIPLIVTAALQQTAIMVRGRAQPPASLDLFNKPAMGLIVNLAKLCLPW